ncbi:MAG TPA: hypothetical protein VIQ30_20365 [Pseudonocardia sp.]
MRLPAVRFRFCEEDRETYGDDWWTFDEAALAKLRAKELVAIDDALREGLGLNVTTALLSYMRGETRGSLAVMWLARRLAGITEPLDGFDPLVMLADTELVKAADADPPASTSSPLPENSAE